MTDGTRTTRPRGWVDFKAVKEAARFEPILDRYGLVLERKGNELVGHCPFHEDSRPSFRVNPEKGIFHCFGCDAKGNILDFVARKEGVAIKKATELVAEWSGMEATEIVAPRASGGPKNRSQRSESRKPVAAPAREREEPSEEESDAAGEKESGNRPLTFALRLDPAHPYLVERGLNAETIAFFGLGLCSRGVMKGRIAIPIHDAGGDLVAYAGRWPGDPPEGEERYKLPPGFKKSEVLFNLYRVKEAEEIVLVEGYWSVFRLHQLGFKSAALMGSDLSAAQEELIFERADRVVVMTDGDRAGREAQAAIVSRLAPRLWVRTAELPEGSRPDTVPAEVLTTLLAW